MQLNKTYVTPQPKKKKKKKAVQIFVRGHTWPTYPFNSHHTCQLQPYLLAGHSFAPFFLFFIFLSIQHYSLTFPHSPTDTFTYHHLYHLFPVRSSAKLSLSTYVLDDEVFFFRVSNFRFCFSITTWWLKRTRICIGFFFFFLRIRLGWAFGYLFRIDVGHFFWVCSVKSKQICSVKS